MPNNQKHTYPPGQKALHLLKADRKNAKSSSYFGGTPCVPDDWVWPTHKDRPIDFLVSINLEEVQKMLPIEWLPAQGTLLFFFDTEEQPWGFDGSERDGWRVFFISDNAKVKEAVPQGISFKKRPIFSQLIETYPDGLPHSNVEISERKQDSIIKKIATLNFGKRPRHQLLGLPDAIQNSYMQPECELASNGVFAGTNEGYESTKGQDLLQGEGVLDWQLLLQLDTDDSPLGMRWNWGDNGMIYFWVKESQARKACFNEAWTILQCF